MEIRDVEIVDAQRKDGERGDVLVEEERPGVILARGVGS